MLSESKKIVMSIYHF